MIRHCDRRAHTHRSPVCFPGILVEPRLSIHARRKFPAAACVSLLVLLAAALAAGQTVPGFEPGPVYNSGGLGNNFLAYADVNGDGIPDLVVDNFCSGSGNGYCDPYNVWLEGAIGVLLGNSDGTFQPPVVFSSGIYENSSLAVGDISGDGKPDLAVVSLWDGAVSVLLGNGDGTFQAPLVVYNVATSPTSIIIGDVNLDGRADLVIAGGGGVTVLLGNGNGTFQTPVFYSSGGSAYSAVRADVNGDGKPDLVVANECSNNTCGDWPAEGSVAILLGNGDGTFQPAVTYDSGGDGAESVAVADLSADGKPDVVAVNYCVNNCAAGSVGVLRGNGDGTFHPVVAYPSFARNQAVAVVDVNGDNIPDVVVANGLPNAAGAYTPGTASVLAGRGDGTFQPAALYTFSFAACGWTLDFRGFLTVANINNKEGQPDLLVGDGCTGVHVLLNMGGAYNPTTTTLASNADPQGPNQTVSYTATVTNQNGGSVTGSIAFQPFGGSPPAVIPLRNNQAVYTASYKKPGRVFLSAIYSGDANNAASTSSGITEFIQHLPTPSKTVLTTSGSPSLVGQPLTFTATVTWNNGTIPNGTLVTFYDSKTEIGTRTTTGGIAAFTTSTLMAKKHTIIAIYAGDATFTKSKGTLTQVVEP